MLLFHRGAQASSLDGSRNEPVCPYQALLRGGAAHRGISLPKRARPSTARCGSSPIQHTILRGTLSRFRASHPNVFVSVRTGNTDEVMSELRAYNAEIGVVGSMDPGGEFETLDLGSTPIVAFAAKGYLPKETDTMSLGELAERPLVFREKGSKTRQKLEEEAARQKVDLRPAIEVEGREAMREVVASAMASASSRKPSSATTSACKDPHPRRRPANERDARLHVSPPLRAHHSNPLWGLSGRTV